jgi:hypothetical protein
VGLIWVWLLLDQILTELQGLIGEHYLMATMHKVVRKNSKRERERGRRKRRCGFDLGTTIVSILYPLPHMIFCSHVHPSRPYDFLLACYSKNYSSKRKKKNAFIESIGVIVHRIKEGHLVTLCMS